jgi:hypothetical protein
LFAINQMFATPNLVIPQLVHAKATLLTVTIATLALSTLVTTTVASLLATTPSFHAQVILLALPRLATKLLDNALEWMLLVTTTTYALMMFV